jgi:L-fuconolactonase
MLDFGIVDTHVHLWDMDKFRYPWLDVIPQINRTLLLNDYKRACGDINVEKIVFMQCECEPSQHLEETAWITELAKKGEQRIKGIISYAPLELGAAVEKELAALAQNPLVKGIRRIIQFEPDLEFCLEPDFIAGVKLLPKYGFTFEVTIAYYHNANTLKFLEQIPEVSCIIDHIGKPGIKDNLLDPWRREMKDFTQLPNVYMKVSSLATEADHENWTINQLRPYVDCIFENFGFERTCFGGDWPVSSLAATYPTCVNTLLELVSGASKQELYQLFRSNAERFYRV